MDKKLIDLPRYRLEQAERCIKSVHFLLSYGHNYAIIVSKKGVTHYATYHAY